MRLVEFLMHGWNHVPQICSQRDKRLSGGSKGITDRHFAVDKPFSEQIQGEDLGVVVVMDDFSADQRLK